MDHFYNSWAYNGFTDIPTHYIFDFQNKVLKIIDVLI